VGKRDKEKMVTGTVLFGITGLLITSARHYTIPEGTRVQAYVDADTVLPRR
jgi:hypothetical protein